MTMKLALTVLLAGAAMAQIEQAQSGAAALKESLALNQAKLRAYSWIEATQISLKGEVKKEEQKQCHYGPDGKVQKASIGGSPSSTPQKQSGGDGKRGGRLKEKIVENKVDELKEYMERVAALVHEYVPPDGQRIQAAQAAGKVAAQPAGSTLNLTVKDYAKPGDSLAIGLDTVAKQLMSYSVQSYVEKPKDDEVMLNVTFGRLQDGTSYPQQVLLDAPAKKIQVKVTNSGYKKTGS